MASPLNPAQFGEFRDPDEPFTYNPDQMRPKSSGPHESYQPFDPYEDSDVGPMTSRVN